MNRSLLVLTCVVVGCFAVVATSAVLTDGSDELGDDTGVFLSPADTPNGGQYAEIDDNGELFVSLDTVSGTATTIDDVFVIGYADEPGRAEPVEVSITYDDDVITIDRMDTGESVNATGDTVVLSPGETVTFGFVARADGPGTVVEEVTYSLDVPDDPDVDLDPGSEEPFYNVTIDNVTTPVIAGDDVVVNATVENRGTAADVQTVVLRDFAGEVVDETALALSPGENASLQFVWSTDADNVGTGDVTVASRNDTDYADGDRATVIVEATDPAVVAFDFGGPVLAWYVWLLVAAMLTVLTDYLVQTQLRGVVPLLQTPEETRKTRLRYAATRLAALWLVALVFALTVLVLLWLAGVTGWPLFAGVLLASIALGGVLGYFLRPDIQGEYVDVEGSGEGGGGSPTSGPGPDPSQSGAQSPEEPAVFGESGGSGADPVQQASDESTPQSDGGEPTSADSAPSGEEASTSTDEDARAE